MEQELWTLTLKGGYNLKLTTIRFHNCPMMCHEVVPTEKKKIERYVRRGFPERITEISLHLACDLDEAIHMARELVQQSFKEMSGQMLATPAEDKIYAGNYQNATGATSIIMDSCSWELHCVSANVIDRSIRD
ncbi:hypothetical protein Tco_0606907 [Tanacetum coccineum]